MAATPRMRLWLLHGPEFFNLDGDAALAVEFGLRESTAHLVAPTLLAGWAADKALMLRVPGPPVSLLTLEPGAASWTSANRSEYIRQQAVLIDASYGIAATAVRYCQMCTETTHCDRNCNGIVDAEGQPVSVKFDYGGAEYSAQLVLALEWESS